MSNGSIDSLYADAYAFIEQGLCYDEVDDKENAKKMYERGLEMSDKALEMDKAEAGNLRKGLIRVNKLVKERLVNIGNKVDQRDIDEIRGRLDSIGDSKSSDAELYYWLPDGIQLVVIEDGQTNAPSPPSSLAIFKLEKQSQSQQPAAFIQVGPWAYPLIPGQTSILKNELGVYVMPNPTQDHPNMFVGIILPRNIEPRLEDEFNIALQQFSVLKTSAEKMSTEQRHRTSERIAQFLIQTGQFLAQNTQNVASKTGKFVADKGEQYRANMEPTNQPVNINPAIRHGVFILHKGSKVVAKVTRHVRKSIARLHPS